LIEHRTRIQKTAVFVFTGGILYEIYLRSSRHVPIGGDSLKNVGYSPGRD